ncbi:PREDICTED: uncharacterized protein LOC104824071 [Tarenaya hassleriana]|uniref:uncharacterized protein LOC104824071 n=1 Tax=Tarenaya hassleriana TaxID=28532 RepID=UPI00053C67EC|nr:PREDICTED: uncharacterized protein LOC104824071 [Tarenaya hassleriana]
MAMSHPPPVNLWLLLSESKRIINAHSRHFLALSVLFLLPLCFSATVYPSVIRLLSDQSTAPDSVSLLRSGLKYHPSAAASNTVVLLQIVYSVVSTVFNLLATGSITYSVLQGFYGRPVKLLPAIKSGFASFFPLLGTSISIQIIVFGVTAILVFSAIVLNMGFDLFGIEINFSSPYSLALVIVLAIVLIAIVTNLCVDWILVRVIVVIESKWGFTPLKRSKTLVKGMRGVSFSLTLFFVFTGSVLTWSSFLDSFAKLAGSDGATDETRWTNAFFVLKIVITSAFLTLLLLYNMAAITVLYVYCKAAHGEFGSEIGAEFAEEYASLPFDDGKVFHLVSAADNV